MAFIDGNKGDTIRGHEYIILNGMYFGDIIHSGSCQCKKGGNDE